MCQMLSYVVDVKGKIYWITPQQRKEIWEELKKHNPDYETYLSDNIANVDSHAKICRFYGINEDKVTKLEVNPFNRHIRLDTEKDDVPSRFVDSSFREFAKILDNMTWEDIQLCHLGYRGYEPNEKYKIQFEKNKGSKLILVSKFLYTYYDAAPIEESILMIEKILDIKLPKKGEKYSCVSKPENYTDYYEFLEFVQSYTDVSYMRFINEDGYRINMKLESFLWNAEKTDIPMQKPVYEEVKTDIKPGDLVKWKGTKIYHPNTKSDACSTMTIGCIRKVEKMGSEGCIHVYTRVDGRGGYSNSYRFSPLDFDKVEPVSKKPYKFKKGDIVKCIKSGFSTSPAEVGKLFTIQKSRVDKSNKTKREYFMVEPRDTYCTWSGQGGFEIVTKKPTAKKSFKVGDKIEANGIQAGYSTTIKGNGYGIITALGKNDWIDVDWFLPGDIIPENNYNVQTKYFQKI